MRITCFLLLLFMAMPCMAQNTDINEAVTKTDSLTPDPFYREDQFYASISYNLVQNKVDQYSQNAFSSGFTFGFLRDIPINKARTYAVAIGLGYSYNNIKQNLFVYETQERGETTRVYEVVEEGSFDKSKQVMHYLEIPLELRWRNSTSYSHKFWRVYTGFKVSYLIGDHSYFGASGGEVRVRNNPDLNKLMCGAYVSAGWNTWNFYTYYGFTPIYKDAYTVNGEKINLSSLNIGLIFYIL